jgi:hypothetical protein
MADLVGARRGLPSRSAQHEERMVYLQQVGLAIGALEAISIGRKPMCRGEFIAITRIQVAFGF